MDPTPLTKYKEGSIKELWTISMPLMITALAQLLMIFVDRCFLARYSLDALNAAVNAGTLAWAFLGGFGMLTAMSEIFVAQYNGAKLHNKMGIPVWQMIWLSLVSITIFLPLAFWGGPLIFSTTSYSSLQNQYFFYLMIFGPFYPMMMSLAGFYIGRGKTRFLIFLAVTANLINVIFDWIFIFGIKGIIPSLGIKGAAIATCLGTIFQMIVLAFMFFKKSNRENFGTTKWKFNFPVFKKCFKVGFPPAVFFTLEIIGWALFFIMMTSLGEQHITISSICQSVVILLSFFFDGLSRGIAALAGNFIGSKRHELVHRLLRSGIKLQVIFSIFISIFLIFDPRIVVDFLIPGKIETYIFNWTSASGMSFFAILRICLMSVFAYLFFEGIRWILAGLLTAAGDTLFLLIAGSVSVWLFLLLPVYLIVVRYNLAVQIAWFIAAGYAFLLCIIYYLRFLKGKWKKIDLIQKPIPEED